ncbi:unnamed protein product [Gordionus sp. m RMFG-2023]
MNLQDYSRIPNIQFKKTQKNNDVIVYLGYEYLNKGNGQNYIYLICRCKCGSRAKLSLVDIVVTKQHIDTCKYATVSRLPNSLQSNNNPIPQIPQIRTTESSNFLKLGQQEMQQYQDSLFLYNQMIILSPKYLKLESSNFLKLGQQEMQQYQGSLFLYNQMIILSLKLESSNFLKLGQQEMQQYQGSLFLYNQMIILSLKLESSNFLKLGQQEMQQYQGSLFLYNQIIILSPKYLKLGLSGDATVTHLQLHSSSSPPLNLLPNVDDDFEIIDAAYAMLDINQNIYGQFVNAYMNTNLMSGILRSSKQEKCLEKNYIENYSEAIPPFISIRGLIDRILKKYRPSMPHSIQDIVLTPAYATSSRSQRFHIPTDDNRILVFGTMIKGIM